MGSSILEQAYYASSDALSPVIRCLDRTIGISFETIIVYRIQANNAVHATIKEFVTYQIKEELR